MQTELYNRKNVFILGAGASVDYGLPVWKDLDKLIRSKIKGDVENRYHYGKDIIAWVDKVGKEKEYTTLDECIKEESIKGDYYSNGDEIENQVFEVMKDAFNEIYKENSERWINKLNDKILRNPDKNLENEISFINYNYDMVLEKNFLKFNYLPGKHQRLNNRVRLEQLSGARALVLYPHGNLYFENEWEPDSHIHRYSNTMKTGLEGYRIDAVSCHESNDHLISHSSSGIKLYIMGLGGGMQLNLNKLRFNRPISEVHVTVRDLSIKEEMINFLSEKFKIPPSEIGIYESCQDLVDKCF